MKDQLENKMQEITHNNVMKLSEFREKFKLDPEKTSFDIRNKCRCSKERFVKSVKSLFPCLEILRNYKWKSDFISDVIAGTTVGILQLPQG